MTVVVVTHELSSIRRIADRVTYLERGRVLFTGTVPEAEGSGIPEVERFFAAGAGGGVGAGARGGARHGATDEDGGR